MVMASHGDVSPASGIINASRVFMFISNRIENIEHVSVKNLNFYLHILKSSYRGL